MPRRRSNGAVGRRNIHVLKGLQSDDGGRYVTQLSACAWSRHLVALLATLIWCGVPVLLLLSPRSAYQVTGSFVLILVVACLTTTACVIRPFCSEKKLVDDMEELSCTEDQEILSMQEEQRKVSIASAARVPTEAELWPSYYDGLKLILFWVGVCCCGVASIICFSTGGSSVLEILMAPLKTDCSVVELSQIQQDGFHKFHCADGFADIDQQRSIMKRWKGMHLDMTVYRIAPVYARDGQIAGGTGLAGKLARAGQDMASNKTIPVAWAVSKDAQMIRSCQGSGGLCGLILHPGSKRDLDGCGSVISEGTGAFFCPTVKERQMFRDLANTVARDLGFQGSSDSGESIPFVALTDPSNPFDQVYLLILGVFLYLLTLITLVAFQVELVIEACRGGSSGSDPSYEVLAKE